MIEDQMQDFEDTKNDKKNWDIKKWHSSNIFFSMNKITKPIAITNEILEFYEEVMSDKLPHN